MPTNMHENPSWVKVSQQAGADIGHQALIPVLILTVLALVMVVLRWFSRVRLSCVYGVEDVVVTLALVSVRMHSFCCVMADSGRSSP